MTHPAIAALGDLAAELRALLARIGAEADGAWQGSWTRCQEFLARYRAEEPRLALLTATERGEHAAALEEVMRLNAVAAGLAARESERIGVELRRVSATRRRVRGRSDAPDTGGTGRSCDVRG